MFPFKTCPYYVPGFFNVGPADIRGLMILSRGAAQCVGYLASFLAFAPEVPAAHIHSQS